MSKLICASTILAFCFAGCGSQNAPSGPATDPSGVDMEFHEPEETESEAGDAEESEATASEAGDAEESGESESAAPKDPPKKSCDGLPQKTCQITLGCAWSTDKKCVDQ